MFTENHKTTVPCWENPFHPSADKSGRVEGDWEWNAQSVCSKQNKQTNRRVSQYIQLGLRVWHYNTLTACTTSVTIHCLYLRRRPSTHQYILISPDLRIRIHNLIQLRDTDDEERSLKFEHSLLSKYCAGKESILIQLSYIILTSENQGVITFFSLNWSWLDYTSQALTQRAFTG